MIPLDTQAIYKTILKYSMQVLQTKIYNYYGEDEIIVFIGWRGPVDKVYNSFSLTYDKKFLQKSKIRWMLNRIYQHRQVI